MILNSIPSDDEILVRFVYSRKQFRADSTVRPALFMPPPDLNMSVTRLMGLSRGEVWNVGIMGLHNRTEKNFYGGADVMVAVVRSQSLDAVAAPVPDNHHHAHIVGWPIEKSKQLSIAQELASAAQFVPFEIPVTLDARPGLAHDAMPRAEVGSDASNLQSTTPEPSRIFTLRPKPTDLVFARIFQTTVRIIKRLRSTSFFTRR